MGAAKGATTMTPPYRTRFRPSLNGPLHLGSLYVAWKNWQMARAYGGQFVLLADADVPEGKYGRPVATELADELLTGWVADLTWFGITPDEVRRSDEPALREAHYAAAKRLGVEPTDGKQAPNIDRYVRSASDGMTAAYQPWLTIGRVSDDHELGISAFVRGGDLYSEAQLYDWLCWQLYGFSYRVQQEYMAQIIDDGGKLSKSSGAPSVLEYRCAGVSPADIKTAFENLEFGPMVYGSYAVRYCTVPLTIPTRDGSQQ